MRNDPLTVQTHSFMRLIQVSEKLKKARDLNRKDRLSLSKAFEMSSCVHRYPPLILE